MGYITLWKNAFIPFLGRREWGAKPNKLYTEWPVINLPLSFVHFLYDDLLTKYNTEEHIQAVKECQRDHMEVQGHDDIKYSFLISREGVVFEGTGWFREPVRLPKYADHRYKGLEVAFIGDYSEKDPPYAALRSAAQLVIYGLRQRFINASYTTISLRDHLQ